MGEKGKSNIDKKRHKMITNLNRPNILPMLLLITLAQKSATLYPTQCQKMQEYKKKHKIINTTNYENLSRGCLSFLNYTPDIP